MNHDRQPFYLVLLTIFNLADNLDMSTVIIMQQFLEIFDIVSGANKGCRNEFDSLFDTKFDNVFNVLVGKGRKINLDTWKILHDIRKTVWINDSW
jgi:hypothetical protein